MPARIRLCGARSTRRHQQAAVPAQNKKGVTGPSGAATGGQGRPRGGKGGHGGAKGGHGGAKGGHGGPPLQINGMKLSSSFSLLSLFHEATLALHCAGELDELLEIFITHAARLSGARRAQLVLHREAFATALLNEIEPPVAWPEDGWPSAGADWLFVGEAPEKTALIAPLFLKNRRVGAVRTEAAPQTALQGAEETAQLLTQFWEHAGAALKQAHLFDVLENAKREWETTFDGMTDGVYIYDERGIILRANLAVQTLLGLPLRQIIGRKRREVMQLLPEYLELQIEKHIEDGAPELDRRTREFRCCVPERIFVETNFALLGGDLEGGQARRVCILQDVTEQRLLQEQMIQTEKLAALGEMLSGVAHELNNPLATVVGYAQLLETDETLPAPLKRQVHAVHHEGQRASQIVQSLLSFSRRSTPEKTSLDLNEVVNSVLEMRAFQLKSDSVTLRAECAEELWLIWGEMAGLQQVLLNIVNNAIQAITQSGQGSEILIRTENIQIGGQRLVRLSVRDDGPGIAPDYLRRIFDPFFTTKSAEHGTGLGMSLAHRTISHHGGTIRAESRLGQGAIFIVELPAAGTGNLTATTTETMQSTAPSAHVLVIDDEEPIVLLISEILAEDGHRVTQAYNGAEALDWLLKEEFDLIISDVRMPAVGGPTFFEILQTTRPDLLERVIFVTGDTVSASTRSFLEKTGRPVLAKPFEPERLRRMANQNLRATAR